MGVMSAARLSLRPTGSNAGVSPIEGPQRTKRWAPSVLGTSQRPRCNRSIAGARKWLPIHNGDLP